MRLVHLALYRGLYSFASVRINLEASMDPTTRPSLGQDLWEERSTPRVRATRTEHPEQRRDVENGRNTAPVVRPAWVRSVPVAVRTVG